MGTLSLWGGGEVWMGRPWRAMAREQGRRSCFLEGGCISPLHHHCFQCGKHILQLNALERKPSTSCCLTKCCKMQVRNKEKRGKREKMENSVSQVRDTSLQEENCSLFPWDIEEEAHSRCQLLLKSIRIQKVISLCKKDLLKKQQNGQQSWRS